MVVVIVVVVVVFGTQTPTLTLDLVVQDSSQAPVGGTALTDCHAINPRDAVGLAAP